MKHLTPRDYTTMPWANGKGQTVEMLRMADDNGVLLRLSRASVVEDGDFSIFPGIERNLTVISGPGFGLLGAAGRMDCAPLCPVAFAGDVAMRAVGVAAPSDDFNVMTARHLPRPEVAVVDTATDLAAGGLLVVYALAPGGVNGVAVGAADLIVTKGALALRPKGAMVVVRVLGLPETP